MVKAFKNDVDIHKLTAAFINDTTPEKVTDSMRSKAKEVNFGVLYGMGSYGLSQRTDVSVSEAQHFLDRYFEEYDTLKEYRENLIESAKEKGYAESITGRRRYLADLGSKNAILRHAAERMAINMPIQGSQADIIKMAMIDCYEKIINKNDNIKMILQIHDELIFEVPENKANFYIPEIKKIMSSAYKLSVPLKVNIKTGKDWKDMKEVI
jgi:DNA polymerase-1